MAIFSGSAKLLYRLLLLFLPSISVQAVQPRFLHGLLSESPMAFPPSAYQFFHPNSPSPAARLVPAPQGLVQVVAESSAPIRGGAEGAMVLVLGFVAVVVFALGAFYLRARRRANAQLMQLPVGGLTDEKESKTKTSS